MDERLRTHKQFERHEVTLLNRQAVQVTGVINVESFDAHEFVLQTGYGLLVIRGDNLHIKSLNLENGLVQIEGMVFDLGYFDDKISPTEKAKGFLGKLFK
ncbi:sporulation protein YabP [Effusibacillus lacus]|uniref:Sporulation protein YabP n=1 Tax=Effusibacillus lacus TaxID=1348429 RepID=A0A292YJI6_9BACL|nr:sporulation protein YabP [Effusibacillus lacus]TCS74471.1 sporulation protein YabP [Effusibacillus lacus]GAX88655.1 sporulation protein YabP [Effusibacillus lacus]